ncbi:hypothetical protein [Bradyrhizobium valentinum]|uniref:hypothetical protein n=1 Tax=Bradyrhizobium valentinum TaxID=1518501 RepID=UPI000709C513|nr:hypothetical protein [Bradyrhizobium valentinum]KRQ94356.1 hypothetical protein CQ10_34160 [Bradyrhizobium valentinum]
MDSLANTKQTDDPHDASPGLSAQEIELVAHADERLAHAYEQIARADEQLARVNEQISKLEQDAARKKSANRYRSSRGRPALRGFVGLLLTAGICIAAFASQSSGETAKLMISRWAPQLAAASPLPAETPKLADQQSPPAVQVAATDGALSQLPPPAQPAPQDAAAAPIPPELTQLLQTMARDLANVQQGIEQLKTSQEEMVRENARTAEQLKASQEQMARAIASASEQNLRRRASAASPPPIATPARGPVSALPPTETRTQARAPVPLRPGQQ